LPFLVAAALAAGVNFPPLTKFFEEDAIACCVPMPFLASSFVTFYVPFFAIDLNTILLPLYFLFSIYKLF